MMFSALNSAIRRCCVLLGSLLLTWLASGMASAADIESMRLVRSGEYTRVIFDVSERAEYSVFVLQDPYRVVIDLDNSRMRADTRNLDLTGGPISAVRSAPRNSNDTRVVLDVATPVNPTSFHLAPDGQRGHRLVVDLYDVGREVPVREARQMPAFDGQRRDIVVAIDAGHGGHDPGAIGYDGRIREKDVALGISRALYERLKQTPGYHPVLLRSGDYFVHLQQRPQLARDRRADIFLSVHADSFSSSAAEGVTVYALSQRTAEAENNRRVADRENAAALLGGTAGDTSLARYEEDLALTLLDLSMSWSIEQSMYAGQHILDAVGAVARLRRDAPQRANLWVLRSPDIPSLLIETGYLSNPGEARRLASPGYQRQLAGALAQGVMGYFHDKPPEGTLIAWQKSNGTLPQQEYVVRSGDSLSRIAQRHDVSLAELRAANGISGDVIRIGQRLRIPGGGAMLIPASAPASIEHTVMRGETLSGIAQRYRVNMARLRESNNLRGDVIRIGQVLLIPTY